jgi:drug/metabolite transporter (DMT)-like permease
MLFAFYVQNYAVRKTSPTHFSLLMGIEHLYLVPFLPMVWLQEFLTVLQLLGGALILFSVIITSTRGN